MGQGEGGVQAPQSVRTAVDEGTPTNPDVSLRKRPEKARPGATRGEEETGPRWEIQDGRWLRKKPVKAATNQTEKERPKEGEKHPTDRQEREGKSEGGSTAEDPRLVSGLARWPKPCTVSSTTAGHFETHSKEGNVGRASETSFPRSQPERACPGYTPESESVGKVSDEPQRSNAESGKGSGDERARNIAGTRSGKDEGWHDPDRPRPRRPGSEPTTSEAAQQAIQVVKLEAYKRKEAEEDATGRSKAKGSDEAKESTSAPRRRGSEEEREPGGQRSHRALSEPLRCAAAQRAVRSEPNILGVAYRTTQTAKYEAKGGIIDGGKKPRRTSRSRSTSGEKGRVPDEQWSHRPHSEPPQSISAHTAVETARLGAEDQSTVEEGWNSEPGSSMDLKSSTTERGVSRIFFSGNIQV